MKIDRLLGMTVYLLNHGRTSAATLAQHFEVSRRTVQRDMEALCRAGIPIGSLYGADGGYEILQTFRIERQTAYGSEYACICTALEGLLSAGGDPKVAKLLEKMGCPVSAASGHSRRILLDFAAALEGNDTAEKLRVLEQAAEKQQIVLLDYCDAAGNRTQRQAEPIALCYRWYDWYLLAYCKLREGYRLFRLSRIENLQNVGLPFSRVHEQAGQLLERLDGDRRYLDILLYCRSGTRLPELLQKGKREEKENGDFTVSLRLPAKEMLWRGALLSLGGCVQILSPKELRDELYTMAGAFLSTNGDSQLSPLAQ